MKGHLLLITLGPVQEFIAQARRTRDLWYGSHLLSEVGRAAARALVCAGATLIFPALARGDSELAHAWGPLRNNGQPPLNVPNKVLAEVPPEIDPERLARDVREAVLTFWRRDLVGRVRENCGGLLADGVDEAFAEQIDTFVEYAAAWSPLDEYAVARRCVERAVAARKGLRDFGPWCRGRGAVPKSSLDGARETVLRPGRQRPVALASKYRIEDGEELDAIGLVKRAGGEPDQFLPIGNVALVPWIRATSAACPKAWEALRSACREVGLARVERRDLPAAEDFPFQANILLPSRWPSVFKEQHLEDDAAAWGRRHVAPLLAAMGEPHPYVACLVADGDRMGGAIDRLGSADAHRAFSQALSAFAGRARRIVEQRHWGSLVYAGGDDVLAFLPLTEALGCANDLRCAFAAEMVRACAALPATAGRPTLSVGIGIGHLMESMGDLLELGRAAEKLAKNGPAGGTGGRNALAVIVDRRSGGQRGWHTRWTDHGGDPVARIDADRQLLAAGRLSTRKVYELHQTLTRWPKERVGVDREWARILTLEVRRTLSRVEAGREAADPALPEELGLALDPEADYDSLRRELAGVASRLLVGIAVAAAVPTPRGGDHGFGQGPEAGPEESVG